MDGFGVLARTGDSMLPLVIAIVVIAVVAIAACIAAFVITRRKR